MGKSAEVIDEKGVGSAPLRPKSAEVNENAEVRWQRFAIRRTAGTTNRDGMAARNHVRTYHNIYFLSIVIYK